MKNSIKNNVIIGQIKYFVFKELHAYAFILQVIGILIYLNFYNLSKTLLHPIIALSTFLLCIICYRRPGVGASSGVSDKILLILPVALMLGIIAMHIRVVSLDTKFINEPIKNINIIGIVKEVKDLDHKVRVVVDVVNHEGLGKIRVKAQKIEVHVGDRVRMYANLYPPPEVMLPNMFNFYFYFYFQNISAVGYVINSMDVITKSQSNHFIPNFRSTFESRTKDALSKTNAAIINALVTGNSSGLKADLQEKIRDIGIAHIFAISGMHMGILIGLSFLIFQLIFGKIPYLILHYNIRKIAAISALMFGMFYLAVAGFVVSAQRAYIMSSVFLLGVLFDRKLNLFRNLMTAAIIILCIQPESITQPSMQMSFAACLGLIVIYDKWIFYQNNTIDLFRKCIIYFIMLEISTVIAILFTAPFSIYHFQHFSTAAILSNLIIVPIVEFILMPICLLYMLLIPIKLDFLLTLPANICVNSVLYIIEYLHNLQLPNFFVQKIHVSSLLLFTLFGMSLRLFGNKLSVILLICIIINEYMHFNNSYNVIYSPNEQKMLQINDDTLQIFGEFSKIERNMIEKYYNKQYIYYNQNILQNNVSDKIIEQIPFDDNKIYYFEMHDGTIYKSKHYTYQNLPWTKNDM